MSEVLYIRLNSLKHEPVHWLVWSNSEQEIIASGELEEEQLEQLADKSVHREVIAVVPNQDVSLKALNVPGKSQRAIKAAVPYMLEEELAQDVEQLFFAYGTQAPDSHGNNCYVAVIKHGLIQQWIGALRQAGINCQTMVPEVLALPVHDDGWAIAQVNQQYIVRQGPWQGATIEPDVWALALEQWQQLEQPPLLYSYTSLSEVPANIEVVQQPQELLLALIAQQGKPSFNLLQGEYTVKRKQSSQVKAWAIAAGVCGVALLLSVAQRGIELYQVKAQRQAIEDQIIATYKQTFPKTKRVRISTIKSQLKRQMAGVGNATQEQGFLTMLIKLEKAYQQVPGFKTTSIKFDGKRGEIRLTASANDFQVFDRFKTELEKAQLSVTQGAQNNQGDLVTGSLSLKERS